MMSLWDALRMNMMISYQELVRTFPKLTKSECEKMLSGKKEAGVSREQKVKLINFNCEKLQSSRIALYSN